MAAPSCAPGSGEAGNLARAFEPGPSPDDIAVVGATLYVSLLSLGRVVAYGADGRAAIVATGLHDPEGIAPGPAGSLYVVEQGLDRVVRLSLDGSGAVTPVKAFPNPKHLLGIDSIRAEPDGRILVPDSPNGTLLELDPATGDVTTLAGGLRRPVDAVAYAEGYAVADETLGLVLVPRGTGGAPASSLRRVPGVGGLDDLAVDAGGALYATGINDGVLYRYRGGRVTAVVRGFRDPQGLAFTADGSLLVADSARNAILRVPAACL